tara:strand:+ start:740 stop:1180 length:441 start_codon:yes stop_codon:yes gene_type:complete
MKTFRKGDRALVKYIDNKVYPCKINKKNANMYYIKYENGSTDICHSQNIFDKNMDPNSVMSNDNDTKNGEKSSASSVKKIRYYKDKPSIKNAFLKIGKSKVNFGKYANQLTYSQLLKQDEEYCRTIVALNYKIPQEFKNFCCYMLM